MKKSIFVKALAILTATVLLIASFAGCAGNESGASNSTASTADKADSSTADVVYRTLDEIKSSGKITPTKIPLVMWMKTANIRAMTFTLQTAL